MSGRRLCMAVMLDWTLLVAAVGLSENNELGGFCRDLDPPN